MSLKRRVLRNIMRKNGELVRRSVRRKFATHIIEKGTYYNPSGELRTRELHATKGWRKVPAWT